MAKLWTPTPWVVGSALKERIGKKTPPFQVWSFASFHPSTMATSQGR